MVEIVARGWDHRAWRGDFYPDDLPPDWRLGFYANAFAGVLVPSHVLLASDEDERAAWVADTGDEFLLHLEIPVEWLREHADLSRRLAPLAGRVGAALWPAGSTDHDRRRGAAVLGGLRPAGADGDDAWEPRSVWTPPEVAPDSRTACGNLGLLPSGAAPDLRVMRARMEDFATWSSGSTRAVLCLLGDPPSAGLMQQARTLADLLAS